MALRRSFALCFFLVLCLPPALAQSAQGPESSAQPQQPEGPTPAESPLPDPAAYVLQQFGSSYKLAPSLPPLFGDLDGDGAEDVVLFATSATPLLSREQFNFKVEDPYDAYFGTDDVSITSQFTLHFDSSASDILIVFGWRQPAPVHNTKRFSKFVLINTPFVTASLVDLRLKKKNIKAIEAVDRTTLHSLVFWDGKHWRWNAQGLGSEEPTTK